MTLTHFKGKAFSLQLGVSKVQMYVCREMNKTPTEFMFILSHWII